MTPSAPRTTIGLILLAGSLVACGGHPAPQVGPAHPTGPRPADLFQLPREVPGYTFVDTSAFPQANAGISYRYRGANGLRPDVYLYPHPPAASLCRGECRDDAARVEAANFRDLLPALIERKYYDSMVVIGDEPLRVPSGSWVGEGRHLTLRTVSHGQTATSHFMVWAGAETYLKIRATYPIGTVPDTQVRAFAEEILRRTPPPYTCGSGPSNAQVVSVSTAFPDMPKVLVQRIDSVLGASATSLDFRAPDRGLWRSAPTFTWPSGTATERWTRTTNPGYVLFVRAEPQGDSTSVSFSAQTLCAAEPASDSVARSAQETLPMLAALLSLAALRPDAAR